MFHRIGSVGSVDAFETVSACGRDWDLLYMSMYHPRRSTRPPAGYRIGDAGQTGSLLHGTTSWLPDFPNQMNEAVKAFTKRAIGLPLPSLMVQRALQDVTFRRPAGHRALLEAAGRHFTFASAE